MAKKGTDNRVVWDVPEAGAFLGLSRNASYEAAARGDLPTIRIGKLLKVPKVAFARMLTKTETEDEDEPDAEPPEKLKAEAEDDEDEDASDAEPP